MVAWRHEVRLVVPLTPPSASSTSSSSGCHIQYPYTWRLSSHSVGGMLPNAKNNAESEDDDYNYNVGDGDDEDDHDDGDSYF